MKMPNLWSAICRICLLPGLAVATTACRSATDPAAQPATEVASTTSEPAPATSGAATVDPDRACPMGVVGAHVAATDVESGVSLEFTTNDPASLDDLQARVRHMAQMFAASRGPMAWHHPRDGRPGMHGARRTGRGPMPPARVAVDETESGAILTLAPVDPLDLDDLRTRAHAHAERMQTGECPYFEGATD